jgi:hypothetical protein
MHLVATVLALPEGSFDAAHEAEHEGVPVEPALVGEPVVVAVLADFCTGGFSAVGESAFRFPPADADAHAPGSSFGPSTSVLIVPSCAAK